MRSLLTLASISLIPALAFAGNQINLEYRQDLMVEAWDNVQVEDPEDSTAMIDKSVNTGFNLQRLRTDFKGTFANAVKYRLRLRLDKTFGTQSKIGSISALDKGVDYAFVQPKINDKVSVKLGKMWLDAGGWEMEYASSDVYLFSTIEEFSPTVGLGVKPVLSLMGQEFSAVFANSNAKTSEDGMAQQFPYAGVNWFGAFGNFKPLVALHIKPVASMTEGEIYASAGLRYDLGTVEGDFDFQSAFTNGEDLTLADDGEIDQLLSFSTLLRINLGNLRPQVKAFYDMHSLEGDAVASVLGISAGTEFYPDAEKKYRYHLMVTDKITTPEGEDAHSDIKVYLGVACNLEMWKN